MEEVVEAAEAGCWVLRVGWVGLVIVMWCGAALMCGRRRREGGGERIGGERIGGDETGGREEGRQRVRE